MSLLNYYREKQKGGNETKNELPSVVAAVYCDVIRSHRVLTFFLVPHIRSFAPGDTRERDDRVWPPYRPEPGS